MPHLKLTVLSLRYSSWSMRPWLVLRHAGVPFELQTVTLAHMQKARAAQVAAPGLTDRRMLGSVNGLFPVLRVDGLAIHESLAICEYVAEQWADAGLWPDEQLARARARAISCEMLSGFSSMRNEMSSHLFARVPDFVPSSATQADIDRVIEIWNDCLDASGGPFLFGRFSIADAMYFPVLGRFRTYGIELPPPLQPYAETIEALPAVRALIETALEEPALAVYDDYIMSLGGDPVAARPAQR